MVASNFSPAWDVLRRLAHVAIRKYAQSEKLANLVAEITDREIEDLLGSKKEKRTGVVEFVESVIGSVLAMSTAGDR